MPKKTGVKSKGNGKCVAKIQPESAPPQRNTRQRTSGAATAPEYTQKSRRTGGKTRGTPELEDSLVLPRHVNALENDSRRRITTDCMPEDDQIDFGDYDAEVEIDQQSEVAGVRPIQVPTAASNKGASAEEVLAFAQGTNPMEPGFMRTFLGINSPVITNSVIPRGLQLVLRDNAELRQELREVKVQVTSLVANVLQADYLSTFNLVDWPATYARKAALVLRPSRMEQRPKDCGGPCSLGSLSNWPGREVLKVIGRVRSDYLPKMKTRLDKVLENPLLDDVKALADDNDLTAEQCMAEQREAASV
ncbi:hypothetical protein K470DRAFT_264716 [Piedraia hortae CBS 480.64]|uniref:Uncharacterized protein n=1 Tax=Piedraia hortae CBS 480.64 TaxID=1314780 RepID=A0A6A7BYI8_9PEZI|nr:hypothetical protein K470DRAFT_264716 [Piedraia hortae CBS 480.64]